MVNPLTSAKTLKALKALNVEKAEKAVKAANAPDALHAPNAPPASPPAPPSLTRRVAATLLAAFAAVFVVLFLTIAYSTLKRESGEFDRGMLLGASSLARALEETSNDASAGEAFALVRRMVLLTEDGEPAVDVAAARLDGRLLLPAGSALVPDLLAQPTGVVNHPATGLRLYVAQTRQWKVAMLDRAEERRHWLLKTLFADLAFYVLVLALPIVLLPVWWAVRTALRPLQRLSEAVAQRSPLDTSPLPAARTYRELQPLETALNQLFERVAHGLAREKAFVHDAAHEMRTPLAVVATQAQVLLGSQGEARDEAHQRLQAAVARASHLTQQLLDLARADTATPEAQDRVDLMNLVRDAMALLAERAEKQGTELELIGPEHAPLLAHARALRSIVDNLLDNALRHGGPGGAVTLQLQMEPHQVHLRVSDAGPGIAAADHERVFERFWRGSERPGTGLGLAIVRQAARAMGGEAWVDAHSGPPGAVLCVRLPVRTARGPVAAEQGSPRGE